MVKKKLSTIASNPLVVNTTSYSDYVTRRGSTGSQEFQGLQGLVGATGSRISTSTSGITSGIIYTICNPISKYIVLDKEIEVSGYKDFNTSSCIALINTIGIKFYIELKKQDVRLPKEIEDFLEKEIVSYYRNSTIDEIMK